MSLSNEELEDLKQALRRCSVQTLDAAIRFRERGELDAIPQIIYGLLERNVPATHAKWLQQADDKCRFVEDMGLDSLSLLEIVLAIEEVVGVNIPNEELKGIRTLGDMKQFLSARISGGALAARSRQYSRDHIALIMPQQPPFLFLDTAMVENGAVRAEYVVKGDEFFLQGHFKGNPVFPASIIFEAMGQAACLYVLETAPASLGKPLQNNQVFFASMGDAHVYRQVRPGDALSIEAKLVKLREPLAVFESTATCKGERTARVERLILAFGEQAAQAVTTPQVLSEAAPNTSSAA